MVAVPSPIASTFPLDTVATLVSSDSHVIDAPLGTTVARIVCVSPTSSSSVFGLSEMLGVSQPSDPALT